MPPSFIALTEQLSALRDSIRNRPPFCSGTQTLPSPEFRVFFEKDSQAHIINLDRASEENLKLLADACSPATFGHNQEAVLDETYRKAGKLDKDLFSTNFRPDHTGVLDAIRSDLLSGLDGTRPIRLELYKLNVYAPPRYATQREHVRLLGHHLPTKHEGGALALRHKGQEWIFDSATEVAAAAATSTSQTSIGYVAFFSDVEHEVLPVTSGYRVTLTSNLYFDGASGIKSFSSTADTSTAAALSGTSRSSPLASKFQDTFSGLLNDPTFLPDGGYLGFALEHQYPFNRETGYPQRALAYLKGSDAMIYKVAEKLNLDISLRIAYRVPGGGLYKKLLLTERFINKVEYQQEMHSLLPRMKKEGDLIFGVDEKDYQGDPVFVDEDILEDDDDDDDDMEEDSDDEGDEVLPKRFLNWVTEPTSSLNSDSESCTGEMIRSSSTRMGISVSWCGSTVLRDEL